MAETNPEVSIDVNDVEQAPLPDYPSSDLVERVQQSLAPESASPGSADDHARVLSLTKCVIATHRRRAGR